MRLLSAASRPFARTLRIVLVEKDIAFERVNEVPQRLRDRVA